MCGENLFGMTLRAYLAGRWTIARSIDDRRAGSVAAFEGEGVFAPEGDALLYRETGVLTVGGIRHDAAQTYRWHFAPDGRADISFADGRPFHTLAPIGLRAEAHHRCPPDDYRVRYRFDAADAWTQEWQVAGPRKDYTARTRFTRLHRAGHPVQSPRET